VFGCQVYVTGKRNAKGSTSIIYYRVSEVDKVLLHALVDEIFVSKLDRFSSAFYYKMIKMKAGMSVGRLSHPIGAGEDRGVRSIQWWPVVVTGVEEEEN
jgi:hypothetical protein